jgi:hypothetical protein
VTALVLVAAVLRAEGGAGLVWGGEGVEPLVGPVVQHLLEGGLDEWGGEVLQVVEFGFAPGVVVAAGEQVDGAVVVDGADHAVEVDDAVEELPRDIPLQCFQKRVSRHHMTTGGPVHVHEIVVTAEPELPKRERAVAGFVRS